MTEKDSSSSYRSYIASVVAAFAGFGLAGFWTTWARVTSAQAEGINLGPTILWVSVGLVVVVGGLWAAVVLPAARFIARVRKSQIGAEVFVARRMPETRKSLEEAFGDSFDVSYLFAVVSTTEKIEFISQRGSSAQIRRVNVTGVKEGTTRVGAFNSPCAVVHADTSFREVAIPLLCRRAPWTFFFPPPPSGLRDIVSKLKGGLGGESALPAKAI